MIRQFSSGGIVFNKESQVLLVQSSANQYWQFPKGLIEEGQTSKEAALREVKEEGGVEAEILASIGQSKYMYQDSNTKEKIFKVVTFYLMKYLSGDPKDHDWEISEAKWVDPTEALKTLKFSDQKKLLEKALTLKLSLSSKF